MSATRSKFIFPEITRYNAELPVNDRIMVTAIDIEHSIRHSRELTVQFLKHLITCCSSNKARQELDERVSNLLKLNETKEIHDWISDLQDRFGMYSNAFPSETNEEVCFSLNLMHDSLDYHVPENRFGQDVLSQDDLRMLELRAS